jgi:putative tryptophan/tyrosine transport system substrate-binding protein
MFRAILLVVLTITLVTEADAQARVRRIGVIPNSASAAKSAPFLAVFQQRLQELGYRDDRNITIDVRYPKEQPDGYREVAAQLVALNVDVIVTANTGATRAAKQQTSTIPIVMVSVGDAVSAGFVTSLSRPGGNVTGQSFLGAELNLKGFDLLTTALPRVKRIGVLYDPELIQGDPPEFRNIREAAAAKGVTIVPVRVRRSDDLKSALANVAPPPEALHALAVSIVEQPRIAQYAVEHQVPTICSFRDAVDSGALMFYGPNFLELWRGAAVYVDKILKGANPADLPVQQPTAFELVINMKTAKTLGVTLPASVLTRADQLLP